jgi:glucose/arabinose dehydrogenase
VRRPLTRHRRLRPALTLLLVLAVACTAQPPDGPAPGSSLPAPDPTAPAPPPRPPDPRAAVPAPGLPPVDRDLPPVTLTEIARLDAPIDTALLPDGTVLVAERAGVVRVLIRPEGAASDAPAVGSIVVDVRDRTSTGSERGLLSIAVPSDGGELFLSLTDDAGDTRIEAHPLVDGRVTGPPRTIYALAQPRANHNGGQILFAPDGMLLVGLGDGGGSGDPLDAGQDLGTPLGSVLRLDVRGGTTVVPPDNPHVGRPGAAPEIAASGLRNPWRMSLDAPRGELWIADVGQSEREEVNRIDVDDLLGANFGWALREGDLSFRGDEPEGHVPPVHVYAHGPGCAITGGHVYRGRALPELAGAYLFSDYCDGELRVLLDDRGTVVARALGVAGERIVGFGRDADGELLVLELGGRVLRLGPA